MKDIIIGGTDGVTKLIKANNFPIYGFDAISGYFIYKINFDDDGGKLTHFTRHLEVKYLYLADYTIIDYNELKTLILTTKRDNILNNLLE